MKILELQIEHVRGLPDLHLAPGGRNLVIWGPNGSGKSGVVDAIDFLLTGRISRLTGRGTGGITLARHGPHIDSSPTDARVRATVLLPGFEEPIVVGRCIASPDVLECPDDAKATLRIIEKLARRGQHILTRRDILRYITADAGTRAEEIQELLDLSDIEELRRSLVTASNRLREECGAAERDAERQKSSVSSALQQSAYSEGRMLEIVNENRHTLGAGPVGQFKSSDIKRGLSPPPSPGPRQAGMNIRLLEDDIPHLTSMLRGANAARVAETDRELRRLLGGIRSDPRLRHELAHVNLTERGLKLLDGSGKCPLCETQWDAADLKKHLEAKVRRGREAQAYQSKIDSTARSLRDAVDNLAAALDRTRSAARTLGIAETERSLGSWSASVQQLSNGLTAPLESYTDDNHPADSVSRLYAPPNADHLLKTVAQAAAARYAKATPQQVAWDRLIRLEDRLGMLERDLETLARRKKSQERADLLLNAFEAGRDKVLRNLYDEIRDRFVEFYRMLHGHEADHFSASITPEGPALDFRVDFLGRGRHPPHALHSEGHQDSMGLCLFLALSERLSGGHLDLVVLDDVVMSVDREHRADICTLLTSPFPNKQFILTTHDRTWASQLRSAGVVGRSDWVEFARWTIETGPMVGRISDLWDRVEEALQRSDVHDAASRLRRGCEQNFEAVCDALKGKIAYRTDYLWELGDWLPAVMQQYKSLLKAAKASAQSWNNSDVLIELDELDSVRAQIFQQSQVEQWAINPNVHYSKWMDLSAEEFRAVVDAFRDLFGLFQCSRCSQLLRVTWSDGVATAVKCACGKVNWNLQSQPGQRS